MNKIYLCLILQLSITSIGYSAICSDASYEKFRIKIGAREYYLVPANNSLNIKGIMNNMPDENNKLTCMGTLQCYKCCTGKLDDEINESFCDKTFENWKKGSNCNCD